MGYKLTGMYIGQDKIRPSGWQPGPDTLAYYPLNSNADDYSGKGNNATASSGVSYAQGGNSGYGAFDTYGRLEIPGLGNLTDSELTLQTRIRTTSTGSRIWEISNWGDGDNGNLEVSITSNGSISVLVWSGGGQSFTAQTNISDGVWHLFTITKTSDKIYTVYVDGVVCGSGTITKNVISTSSGTRLNTHPALGTTLPADFDEVIIDGITRTAQEVVDYFDLTKGYYGIS